VVIQADAARLAAEKAAALENQLEAEQEFMMHRLQRQVLKGGGVKG